MVAPHHVEVVVVHEGVHDEVCSGTSVVDVAEDVEAIHGKALYESGQFGDEGIGTLGLYDGEYNLVVDNVKRFKMAEAARNRVKKYFRHEDMINNYLEVYDEVFRRWQE